MTQSVCIYREERDGSHIEIWDEGDIRSLWFDDVILQSQIHTGDPAVLPNPVNRQMLAALMFDRPLKRALLAGCGGGAIARWLNARAPDIYGDAIEVSPTVARLAHEYFDFPRADSRWRLLVDDVRENFARSSAPRYDYILVDLEENQQTPSWVSSHEFLEQCRVHLSPLGTLTLNLILGNEVETGRTLARIRRVFETDTLLLRAPKHDNLLVCVSPTKLPPLPDKAALAAIGRQWGIDFVSMRDQLTRVDATADASD